MSRHLGIQSEARIDSYFILFLNIMKRAGGIDKAKRIRTLPEIQRILDAVHGRVFY